MTREEYRNTNPNEELNDDLYALAPNRRPKENTTQTNASVAPHKTVVRRSGNLLKTILFGVVAVAVVAPILFLVAIIHAIGDGFEDGVGDFMNNKDNHW